MKIFIIGSRGYYRRYGGWETFVKNLVDYSRDKNIEFHVWEVVDKKLKQNIEKIDDFLYIHYIYTKFKGSLELPYICIKATFQLMTYIKKQNITEKTILYVLGYRVGHFYRILKDRIRRLNLILVNNPDGIEYLRDKWNKIIRIYWKRSEKHMIQASDHIVCDSLGIKEHTEKKYPISIGKTSYISYGVKSVNTDFDLIGNFLNENKIVKNNYYLMVGRFVPENNYELIISEFLRVKRKYKLLIVSNLSINKYYKHLLSLVESSEFKSDIVFSNPVYDEQKIASLRKYAFAYIHGHSVGGTNPSLLESMMYTNINILFNVNFNVEVGNNSAYYFDKSKGNLSSLLINLENNLDLHEVDKKIQLKMSIVENDYNWQKVSDNHYNLFKKMIEEEK